ncbi:MAG: low molecular weight protein arginine phosphatase [Opitutaceae bacterium]|jgi:protein-tyrosine phosphatase|nr:low molecular weight protein arginine phosphatase [Opitutaceae bacterium]
MRTKPKNKPGTALVVCTGNICRSPVGEVLLRHALAAQPEPLRSLKVASAGVAAMPSWPASEHSETVSRQAGLSLEGHRSRQLTQALVDDALAIYCMTEAHRLMILAGFERTDGKVFLWREFMPPEKTGDIADPYGGDLAEYERCRDEIMEALPSLTRHLRGLLQKQAPR